MIVMNRNLKNSLLLIMSFCVVIIFTNCLRGNQTEKKKMDSSKSHIIKNGMKHFEDRYSERKHMVDSQLRYREISDTRALLAMEEVPRHFFIPNSGQKDAYGDHPVPIGEGQTISQPFMVAIMTQCLELKTTDRALEIGTGSGYQAGVLAELCKEVYTIEIVEPLGKRAEVTLKELGYENVKVKIGDGFEGWKEHAPYDGIIVTCACEEIPQPLIDQLAEGGRLVIPVGEYNAYQTLKVLTKKGKDLNSKDVLDCRFVPLTGPHGIK